jgi:hypothetical protein
MADTGEYATAEQMEAEEERDVSMTETAGGIKTEVPTSSDHCESAQQDQVV